MDYLTIAFTTVVYDGRKQWYYLLGSEFAPDHFVDYADVTLDNFNDLGRDIFIHVVGNGDTVQVIMTEGNGCVNGLEQ